MIFGIHCPTAQHLRKGEGKLPIKKKCSGNSCALPTPAAKGTRKQDEKLLTSLGTSTPVGYSFYSAFDDCERYFANRYLFQIFPRTRDSAPTTGSAYHHLQEHDGALVYAEASVEEMEEARRLYAARKHGPPMPKALEREKLYELDGTIPFTVRPDRTESKTQIRDFKSASRFYDDTDKARWNTEPSIIGQLVAGPFEVCHVDVITKEQAPKTRIFSVKLTTAKESAFRGWLSQVFHRLVERLNELAEETRDLDSVAEESLAAQVKDMFPRKLGHCIKYTKLCPYYARCWESASPEALAYVKGKSERKWFAHFLKKKVLAASVEKQLKLVLKKL